LTIDIILEGEGIDILAGHERCPHVPRTQLMVFFGLVDKLPESEAGVNRKFRTTIAFQLHLIPEEWGGEVW
jgi:hypothetical protein